MRKQDRRGHLHTQHDVTQLSLQDQQKEGGIGNYINLDQTSFEFINQKASVFGNYSNHFEAFPTRDQGPFAAEFSQISKLTATAVSYSLIILDTLRNENTLKGTVEYVYIYIFLDG